MYKIFIGSANYYSTLLFSSREDGGERKCVDFPGVRSGNSPELIHFLMREGIRYFRVKISFLGVG